MGLLEIIYFAQTYPLLTMFYLGIGMIGGQIFDLLYRLGKKIQLAQRHLDPDAPRPPDAV